MRTLIVGGGATGGAFGARLVEAGRDVTFLVRPARARALATEGLRLDAPDGVRSIPVRTVTEPPEGEAFDLIVVAVKAPALDAVLQQVAGAVGPGTRILPFLNGLDHLDRIERTHPGAALGGFVRVVATVDGTGAIVQSTPLAEVTVGELDGSPAPEAVLEHFAAPGLQLVAAEDIRSSLWAKWAFVTAAGVATCLLRGDVGTIIAAGGERYLRAALEETAAVAAAAGHPIDAPSRAESERLMIAPGSSFSSSLYRDLLAGDAQEGEHLLGAMSARAADLGVPVPLLDLALTQLRADALRTRPEPSLLPHEHAFTSTDWAAIEPTVHAGERGEARWRTRTIGPVRIRRVDYSPGYVADHWCSRGHVLTVLDGSLRTELDDGRIVELRAGQGYEVASGREAHRSSTTTGASLLIVD